MFRLPLRSEENAEKSRIKQPPATTDEVGHLLKDFERTMGECLLFLSSVKKVSVYTAKRNGDIELEYKTSLCADDSNTKVHHEFFQHVQQEARKLKTESSALSVGDFTPKEVAVQCCLTDSAKLKTEWLVVHRFGLSRTDNLPWQKDRKNCVQKHRFLPLGGVAICLTAEQQGKEIAQREFRAYCSLPLPVSTGLPVHVNARFALDHETRRNIDTRPDNDLVVWNRLLADRVIVPAYITGLRQVRQQCFAQEETSISEDDTGRDPGSKRGGSGERSAQEDPDRQRSLRTSTDLSQKLEQYSVLFPRHTNNVDAFWKNLMASLYRQLAQTEADVFPVKRTDLDHLLWVPATKKTGFPGFFWDFADHLELKEILLKLNMNIIHCPIRIYEAFQHSSVSDVKTVQEDTVITFLQSCHRPESETDTCNLKHLPKAVKHTTFGTAKNVERVFTFIYKKASCLRELPLDLRVSGKLHRFGHGNPTLVSDFCDLLQESSELFLDKALIKFLPYRLDECEFLKVLDVQTLAKLLPHSLDQSEFGSCKKVPLQKVPDKHWIKRLWSFLDEHAENDSITTCLSQWSLIPASRGTNVHLLPFRDRHNIVDIPDKDRSVHRSLEKLPLQKLNTSLSGTSVATRLVASSDDPRGLLTALAQSDLRGHQLTAREAEHILDFFYPSAAEEEQHKSMIRSLPFFERLDGTFGAVDDSSTRLCLPSEVPLDGLTGWSSKKVTVLLKENGRLKDMFKQLGITSPNAADFYSLHLLPSIADLPSEAIQHHMKYIRDKLSISDRRHMLSVLQKTRFIKGTDGTLCKASDFYSPDNPVFQTMLASDQFPPPPYDTDEWKSFLKELGLVSDVSEDLFIRFAKQVEEAGKSAGSNKVAEQSQELCKCLNRQSTLREKRFLEQLKGVKFLVPQYQEADSSVLSKLHPALKPKSPLVSFSEAYSPDKKFLVWTSACILSNDADPNQGHSWEPKMCDWIGFKLQPPSDIVAKHIKNICRPLLGDFTDCELQEVEKVMESIYQHLETTSDIGLKELCDVAIIFDKQRKAMFLPHQVVITILPDQVVEGHVVGAPERLGKFFGLFRKLGVHEQVTPDHYARVLEQIHRKSAGNVLDQNSLELVSKAVDVLFKLLTTTSREFDSTLTALYLPSEDSMMSMVHGNLPQVKLTDSRQLIQKVNRSHKSRIKNPIEGLAVFVGFQRLGLEGHDLHREAMLLPETYKMKHWNEVVTERLMERCKAQACEDEHTQSATSILHSEQCALVVRRLVNHTRSKAEQQFSEEDATGIDEQLKKIRVLKVTDLRTILNFDGSEIPESEKSILSFIVEQPEDSGNTPDHVTKLSLYVDETILVDFGETQFGHAVIGALSLAIDVKFGVLLSKFGIFLSECLKDLSRAQQVLDEGDITPYSTTQPGFSVPEDMHKLLDQDIYEFKVDECAVYEQYDPIIEEEENTENPKPRYIFAKITSVVTPPRETRLMQMKYDINIGGNQLRQVMKMICVRSDLR